MQLFLKKTVIALSLLIIVLWGLDRVITSHLLSSHKRIYTMWRNVTTPSSPNDIIIMGSSRAWRQISPQIIDSVLHLTCYNLGVDGRCIDTQMEIYNIYRLYHPAPKYIIQILDLYTFTHSNGYDAEQFLPYLHNDSIFAIVHYNEDFSWADHYLPFVRYSGYPKAIMEGLNIPNSLDPTTLTNGYAGADRTWNGQKVNEQDSVGFEFNASVAQIYCNHPIKYIF